MRSVAAILVGGATLWFAVGANAGTLQRARGYPCPAAPQGWVAAASNPTVFGPAQQPGQEHMMISCQYSQASKHVVSVVAEYALPTDPNPLTDFYYGCNARRKQAWTSSGRTYFSASPTRWSYVEFTDPGRQLPDAAAGTFATVAQALLQHVSNSAHRCHINTVTPTLVHHLYLFGFEFFLSSRDLKAFGGIATQSKRNPLIPDGSFKTVSEPDATVLSKVTSVKAPVFTVQIVAKGKHRSLRVRIDHGIDFLQKPPTQRLRLGLEVVSSNYSSCAKRANGTLTITKNGLLNVPNAPASIRLQLCGLVFGRGTYRGTANIITG